MSSFCDVYELALFFHLLGALLFVAGIVLAGVAFEAARRREQPAEIALLLSLTLRTAHAPSHIQLTLLVVDCSL